MLVNLPIIAVSCCYLLKVYLFFARLRGLGLLGFALRFTGADGAAALLHARARVDGRFPDMAVRALSPRLFLAAGCHIIRREW